MKLISSYPRSGSAKLRFIICNILYPEIDHDFTSMSKYVPSIDNPDTRNDAIKNEYMVTHSCISSDIFLYRHVGDCLISEWWFKQKFYPSEETLEEFIIESDYGANWRKSIEAGRSSKIKLSFDDLNKPKKLFESGLIKGATIKDYQRAIKKSTFNKMKSLENKKGFYYLPKGNDSIPYMRNGTSGQWEDLEIGTKICTENDGELGYLDLCHYNEEEGKYETTK